MSLNVLGYDYRYARTACPDLGTSLVQVAENRGNVQWLRLQQRHPVGQQHHRRQAHCVLHMARPA